jgi:hypothetical protein
MMPSKNSLKRTAELDSIEKLKAKFISVEEESTD